MRKLLSFFLVIHFILPSNAQQSNSPYRLSAAIDIPLASSSALLFGGSYVGALIRHMPSKESLMKLKPDDVNKFDRSAIYQHSKAALYISDATLYASLLLPLVDLVKSDTRRDFGKIAILDGETILMNTALTELLKVTVWRKRPVIYNPDVPVDSKYKKDNFQSFYSGHTSTVASMSYFFAKTFSDYHPGSKIRPVVWSLCAAFPVLTATMRYKAGKHFWTDVITGYVAGAVVGFVVPYLHKPGLTKGLK